MKLIRTIWLGGELFFSLVAFYFRCKSLKVALAASILSRFIKAINLRITSEDRKTIVEFAWMSRLINDGLEKSHVSEEELTKAITGENLSRKNSITEKIFNSITRIRTPASRKIGYNNFLESAEKSWKANNLRNIKSSNESKISNDLMLGATKDSGGFFFVAIAHLFSIESLSSNFEIAIYSSGAWFQFLDDYRDRKEDKGHASTIFTNVECAIPKKLLRDYLTGCRTKIQSILGDGHPLLQFMDNLTTLVILSDFIKFDWK